MGSAGQLARSFRRRRPSHRRDEQPLLPIQAQWAVAITTIVSRSALSTIVALLLWSVLPNLVGFQTTTVMSGSMEPRLQVGDAVIVRHLDASGLAKGQVLLFDDPDHPGTLRMHRLVEVRSDGQLVTKGDANQNRDSSTVGFDAVHGAAFLRIPYAGLPNYWIRTDQPLPLIGGGVLVVLLMGGIRLGRLLEDEEERDRRRQRHRGVRLPGLHRATTAGVVLLVLSGGAVVPAAQAQAAYSAATAPPASTWGTMCGDVTPATGATPSLYYGYGTAASTVTDLSASGDTGTYQGGAARVGCTNGWSPYASFNGTSGVVTASKLRNHPTAATVATWFKVNPGDAGGVLAVFGSSGTAASSSGVDDGLYMADNGTLTFGVASIQALGLLQTGYKYCTTAAGYADGSWHLVVATTSSTGCTITVDARSAATVSTPYTLTVVAGAYQGYWRFGYDNVTYGTNAPTRMYFKGALDETQIYDSAVPFSVQTTIFAAGHGGTVN